eukprot:7122476-Prymnesium_polylepis.2
MEEETRRWKLLALRCPGGRVCVWVRTSVRVRGCVRVLRRASRGESVRTRMYVYVRVGVRVSASRHMGARTSTRGRASMSTSKRKSARVCVHVGSEGTEHGARSRRRSLISTRWRYSTPRGGPRSRVMTGAKNTRPVLTHARNR